MHVAPGADAWEPWSPDDVARVLAGCDVPWAIAGGWALDLWLGQRTRGHHDIEIVIPTGALAQVRRHLARYQFFGARDGTLTALPSVTDDDDGRFHQHWVLDPDVMRWRLDVMVEPGDRDWWTYRRDQRIRARRSDMFGRSAGGIPMLLPHGVLLFKARRPRDKDEHDFARCAPLLGLSDRAWLRKALELVAPTHPWLALLQ